MLKGLRNTFGGLIGLAAALLMASANAQPSAFTYQGFLRDGSTAAIGNYDFRFSLYNAANGGSLLGTTTVSNVNVQNGLFTVQLDFGNGAFNGSPRWLHIEVRQAGGAVFTALTPRVEVTPAPWALFAQRADSANSAVSLVLPFSGSSNTGDNAFEVANTGLGRAGYFQITNTQNPEAAVVGTSIGSGPGGSFFNDSGGNGVRALSPLGVALYAESGGALNFSKAVHGVLTGDTQGSFASAIHAENQSTGSSGIGVWASHAGGGYGVYGASNTGTGVYGAVNSGRGVWGRTFGGGYAGYFEGQGYFSGSLGLGEENPDEKLHVAGDVKIVSNSDITTTLGTGAFYIQNTTGTRAIAIDSDELNAFGGPLNLNGANAQPTHINGVLYVETNGRAGVGTSTPDTALHVVGADNNGSTGTLKITSGTQNLYLDGNELDSDAAVGLHLNTNNANPVYLGNGGGDVFLANAGGGSVFLANSGGEVGIGTANPLTKLHVQGSLHLAGTGQDISVQTGEVLQMGHYDGTTFTERMRISGTGRVGIGTTNPQTELHVNGTARVDILQIVGADLAEKFPMSSKVEPGMVVMIDPSNPGQLCLAKGAYNRRVAGVVAGANGLSTGVVLGHLPGNEEGIPIAMSGRVWVYCDATKRAIEPGDLMTTAERPGYAMAATDSTRLHGTLLGKAMTGLEKGKTGMVLVLVNLQ